MRRIRIFVAYDGTNYCGWQTQKNGSHRKKVYRRRSGGISNLLSRFKFVRRKKVRKTKSSSSGYIDGNGKLGYDEYEDDYSYDEPEDMYVQRRVRRQTRIKNSYGKIRYIFQEEIM